MPELRFWEAEKTRRRLTLEQKKFISNMYKELAEKTSLRAESLKSRTNVSSVLRTKYLEDMQKELSSELRAINKRLQSSIPSAMEKAAEAAVDSNNAWMKAVGLDIRGAYSNVPRDVVEDLVSGKLYDGKWTLSKALWSDTKDAQRDIQRVVAEGVAQNKPIYEIAKDLERYVSPTARKAWDWGKVYPGTRKVIDYNAQRLARTMVAHSYQNAFVKTTKDNPFFTAYRWLSGHSERTCDICEDRATKDGFGLGAGVFPKDQLPMDHPNGLCTWVISLEKPMKDITDDIADWYNSPSGTYPDIDKYAGKLGYKPDKVAKKVVEKKALKLANKPTMKNVQFSPTDLRREASKLKVVSRNQRTKEIVAYRNPIEYSMDSGSDALMFYEKKGYTLLDNAPIRVLNIEDLQTAQSMLVAKKLNALIDTAQYLETSNSLPIAIEIGEKYIVVDGNHRIVLQKLLGMGTTNIKVIKFTGV